MISALFRKLAKVAWFLPGFLLWAAFPPMGEKTDVLFALAPLIWLSRREISAGLSARRWFQSGIFFWVATLSWMPAIVKNGGPWPLVVLGWFALAAYCAAYFAAYGWLSAKYWSWTRTRSYWFRLLGILLVEPVLWCGLELVRSRFLGGFAWNQLGVVPANGGFGAPAALGGVYLLSAVVFLVNGTIAGIAERMWKPERSGFPNLRRLGPLETILAFGLVFGIYQAGEACVGLPTSDSRLPPSTLQTPQTLQTHLKVALIQRNFPCVFKGREQNPYEVYGKLLENVAALRPDLVVLAESAMCEFGPVDQQGAVRFARWVSDKCSGASVLAGGTRYVEDATYNSAALYTFPPSQPLNSSTSPTLSLYDKVHLVPFGEFIPGDKWIPALQKLAPVGSCTPGELMVVEMALPGQRVALKDEGGSREGERGEGERRETGDERGRETQDARQPTTPNPQPTTNNQQPTTKLGLAICFEDTDSAQMRELAAKGAQVLVFITNDSWFSRSNETEQHAWQATARAIETGLPVVRVGNSGVTGTIAPDGKATWLIGPDGRMMTDRRGTMFDRVPLAAVGRRTPYVVLGDVPLAVAFLLLILAMILVKYMLNYEKRRILSV